MEQINVNLLQSLQTGFIDKSIISNLEYLPQLLTNDKQGGRKVLSTIDWELKNCEEFWISVAFVTTSGIATIINTLIELQKKGIKGKILVSQYLNFSHPEALKKLLLFNNIELKIAVDGNFHSKGYLFKNGKLHDLIIGSSNLTANALCFNTEWNLKISATNESYIIYNALSLFQSEFDKSQIVDTEYISNYEVIYNKQIQLNNLENQSKESLFESHVIPNKMQIEALVNLEKIRLEGKRKALLISATGTGKTFLSAFDVKKFSPKKFLFVVHRLNIANAAMKTFKTIFGNGKSMGLYSGNSKEKNVDFIFSTIQTLSKEEHLNQFPSDHFDYIVIDEGHRAGSDSYKKILNHFNPKFLLGMTATPERTDGFDIFKLFDHTIAYEIRLHKAMEQEMLSPFHYYGVTDVTVNGEVLGDKTDFRKLISSERVERIIEKARFYGTHDGTIRGLIFCSKVEECNLLSENFNQKGYKTIALTGNNNEEVRADAICRLESDSIKDKLDYIFTVDIFNEGVDIPSVNQIIMLRPTQSAIIFVQQLGRGLRKIEGKDYLTVIDFIGNYSNNYLVPIALYGDTSYNKDTLRKLITSGSNLIPGASTINFDEFSMKKIFESIDNANLHQKKDLIKDYQLLKYRLGRSPMMMDFIEQGSRDPFQFVIYSKSYFNFLSSQEENVFNLLTGNQRLLLELFSNDIANAKRIEEVILLKALIIRTTISVRDYNDLLIKSFSINTSDETLNSCLRNINFQFVRKERNIIVRDNNLLRLSNEFTDELKNIEFKRFLNDALDYAKHTFSSNYESEKYFKGFILYQKYSRKDVCRILNWDYNEEATLFGYKLSRNSCPIFVNYHKEENIASSTKFPEKFLNNSEFLWYSKPNRKLSNVTISALRKDPEKIRVPFFIKKHNGEGTDFYFMGDVIPEANSFKETTIKNDRGKDMPVVEIVLKLKSPVEFSIYNYLTSIEISGNDKVEEEKPNSTNIRSTKNLLKIVPHSKVKPFVNSVPLYDVSIAAGKFSAPQIKEDIEWVELPEPYKPNKDYFVCQVLGESMNRKIPNGSWCLFKKDTGGSREGKIVLVQHYKIQDSDFGAGFTIKEYHSKKIITEESWSHEEIILRPLSNLSDYEDIILKDSTLAESEVLGVFVAILF